MPRPEYDLEDRLIRFGTTVCRLSERLPSTPLGRHIGIQMVRDELLAIIATSIKTARGNGHGKL